jgi:hypothetical protein
MEAPSAFVVGAIRVAKAFRSVLIATKIVGRPGFRPALELYLKCLRLVTGGDEPRTHRLQSLYNGLPGSQKSEIRTLFEESVPLFDKNEFPTSGPEF